MNSHHWSKQREVGSKFLLSVLTWIALHLGRTPARLLLVFITAYFFITGAKARKASKSYLQRILKKPPGWTHIYRHFYYFAAVTLDRLFLMAGNISCLEIELHGEEVFDNLKNSSQGCLLFVSHIGSFDVMRVPGARQHSLPICILMDRNHNSMAIQLIERLDPILAENIIDARQSKPELVLLMKDYLAQGKMIGVMVDRLHEQESGLDCSLLGGTVSMPIGPWQLATVLQVPIITCFGLYHGKNRYSIHFELLSNQIECRRSERDETIKQHIQKYCQRLEQCLSLQPYNWFNFYEFWENKSSND